MGRETLGALHPSRQHQRTSSEREESREQHSHPQPEQGVPVCSGEPDGGEPRRKNAFLGLAGGSEPMDNTKEPAGHLSAIIAIGLLLIGLIVFGVAQQKAWSHQAELTKRFEACMESAPFKQALKVPRPEAVLTDEQLQYHFDAFDQLLKETGLPPIWNGQTLVPWKDYHKNSIEFASQCHSQLGIDQPQQQLKGTYAKPVWDPHSSIWREAD